MLVKFHPMSIAAVRTHLVVVLRNLSNILSSRVRCTLFLATSTTASFLSSMSSLEVITLLRSATCDIEGVLKGQMIRF